MEAPSSAAQKAGLNAQLIEAINFEKQQFQASKALKETAVSFYRHNADPLLNCSPQALYQQLDALFAQLSNLHQENNMPFSKGQQARTVISQTVNIFLLASATPEKFGLTKSKFRALSTSVRKVNQEQKAFFERHDISPAELVSDVLLENNSLVEKDYVMLCANCIDTVLRSLADSKNPEMKAAYLQAIFSSIRMSDFNQKILTEVSTPIANPELDVLQSMGVEGEYEYEKNIGSLFLGANYVLVKSVVMAMGNCGNLKDFEVHSDKLNQYLKLCREYLRLKADKKNRRLCVQLDKHDIELKDQIGESFASIFTQRPMSNLLESFRFYEAMIGQRDDSARGYAENENGNSISRERWDAQITFDYEIATVPELVSRAVDFEQALTSWVPTKSERDYASLTAEFKVIKDGLQKQIDEYENHSTFGESVSWLVGSAAKLHRIENDIQSLEERFAKIKSFDDVALTDDDLFALFEGNDEAIQGNQQTASKKSKTKKNKLKKSDSVPLSQPIEKQAGVKSGAVLPEHAIKSIGGGPVLKMITRGYQTHFGVEQVEILSSSASNDFSDLAKDAWHPRLIFGKYHSKKDNLFYHYHKHCSNGVAWKDRITVQQYCELVRATHKLTKDASQRHRDTMQTILVTPPSCQVKASFANNKREVQCHTLYLHDPNDPAKPIPLTKHNYDGALNEVKALLGSEPSA